MPGADGSSEEFVEDDSGGEEEEEDDGGDSSASYESEEDEVCIVVCRLNIDFENSREVPQSVSLCSTDQDHPSIQTLNYAH